VAKSACHAQQIQSLSGLTGELGIIEKKIDARAEQERAALIEQMDAMAKEKGFGGLDALFGSERPKKKRKPVAPKYRNPVNADETWTGRGRKPRWIIDMLAAGGSLDDALIDKE